MTKNKYLTNRELLTELAKRLPDFTPEEFTSLTRLLGEYNQKFFKSIQNLNPQAYNWIQKKISEHEQEKTEKDTERLKENLPKN